MPELRLAALPVAAVVALDAPRDAAESRPPCRSQSSRFTFASGGSDDLELLPSMP